MLKNEYFVAKIGVDTAETEPSDILKFGWRPTTGRGPCTRFAKRYAEPDEETGGKRCEQAFILENYNALH